MIRRLALELEPETEEIFFVAASAGATFGVRLRGGARRAIKVNALFRDEAYFAELQLLQAALRESGYPAPLPVRRHGTTTVEAWLDEGVFRDAHEPEVRAALARELLRFVELATATGVRPRRTYLRPDGAVWPKPHNALFDFEATASGAEWIDEIGRVSIVPPAGREVVGHLDWAAKHLRFDEALLPTAVYDWDSVTVECEPLVAGQAAASFTYTEELDPPVARWPAVEESLAFLEEYERARGAAFSGEERRVARAACLYLRAYAARCHHAVGGDPAEIALAEFAEAFL